MREGKERVRKEREDRGGGRKWGRREGEGRKEGGKREGR